MRTAFDRIWSRLQRDRGLPLSGLVRKGVTFAVARLAAPVWLHPCTSVGARPRANGRPRIANRGAITVGDDVVINSSLAPVELETGSAGRIELGDDVFLNFGTRICADRRVRIGRNVAIGPYSTISDRPLAGTGAPEGTIEIGPDAWLGARVVVLAGAVIGAGATVTAGSVVAGRIPPGAVAGGVPARVLRLPEPAGPCVENAP